MGEIVRSEWVVDPDNPELMIRRNQDRYQFYIDPDDRDPGNPDLGNPDPHNPEMMIRRYQDR